MLKWLNRKKIVNYILKYYANGKWVSIADSKHNEFLNAGFSPDDMEDPDPGTYRYYAEYKDGTKHAVWTYTVPGSVEEAEGKKKKKSLNEVLTEKIIEQVDFTGLQPSKMTIPFGNMSMEFTNPNANTGGGEGYIVVDGNRYPVGSVPPLEYDGKLPIWMHPAAIGMISGLVDKVGKMINESVVGGVKKALGIKERPVTPADTFKHKGKSEKEKEGFEEEYSSMIGNLDKLLEEGEEE